LCIYLGITEQTWLNYQNNESYKDFFEIFTHVRDIIENLQLEGATVGAYNPSIIARKLGLVDKQDHTTKGESINGLEKLTTEELIQRSKALKDISDNVKS